MRPNDDKIQYKIKTKNIASKLIVEKIVIYICPYMNIHKEKCNDIKNICTNNYDVRKQRLLFISV